MTIQLITSEVPRCFGVGCHLHASCLRYQGVENMPGGSAVIGTCATWMTDERPLFLPVKVVAA